MVGLGVHFIAYCAERLVVTELGLPLVLLQCLLPGPMRTRDVFKGHVHRQQSLVILDVLLNCADLGSDAGPERLEDDVQFYQAQGLANPRSHNW